MSSSAGRPNKIAGCSIQQERSLQALVTELVEQSLDEKLLVVLVASAGPTARKSVEFRADRPFLFAIRDLPTNLFYGSKFPPAAHEPEPAGDRHLRGGIYAQLTTGKPVQIISRTSARGAALEASIDTKKNESRAMRDVATDPDLRAALARFQAFPAASRLGRGQLHSLAH